MIITVASCKRYNEFEYVSTFAKSLISFINSINNVFIFVTLQWTYYKIVKFFCTQLLNTKYFQKL